MKTHRLRAVGFALILCFVQVACSKHPALKKGSASPTPVPTPEIFKKPMDTARLYSGFKIESRVLTDDSAESASATRQVEDNYKIDLTVFVRIPQAIYSLNKIVEVDPQFLGVLSAAPILFQSANISPFFNKFYEIKTAYLRERLSRLDELLSRHNFYDCNTILELQHPVTGPRVLLIQSAMDVNADGSDGDRNVAINGSSSFFQPQTSYRWLKLTDRQNPFLPIAEEKLATLKIESAQKGISSDRKLILKDAIEENVRLIYDLRHYSFLISSTDPFIVLPTFMLARNTDNLFTPKIGDYAIVCYGGKLYPAIVGDAGPSFKIGEASLRICKEINSKASAISRPVDSLKITYLVFPGSGNEHSGPPDLEKWHAQCAQLLAEIGGTSQELHRWEDIVPPWPTPTPWPTPEITPMPSATNTPTASPSPSASPMPEGHSSPLS